MSAVRSVIYGEGNSSYIRHGEEGYRVELDMGDGGKLEHTRAAKGAKKVQYRLQAPDGSTIHESLQAKLPDWVMDTLGLGRMEDMEIQVGHQKSPVFLLDTPPSTQAKILSVGKEAHYLAAMQNDYKQDIKDCKRDVKVGEKHFAFHSRQMERIDTSAAKEILDSVTQRQQAISKGQADIEQIEVLVKKLESLSKIVAFDLPDLAEEPKWHSVDILEQLVKRLTDCSQVVNSKINMPELAPEPLLHDTKKLESLIFTMEKISRLQLDTHAIPDNLPENPRLHDIDTLAALVNRLSVASQIMSLPVLPVLAEEAKWQDTKGITEIGTAIKQRFDQYSKARQEQEDISKSIELQDGQLKELMSKCDGICPVCEQPITSEILIRQLH